MDISIMRNLYDASLKGCVTTLNSLIEEDPLILSRVSLYSFSETPLHIASLLGHIELCQILLDTNPNLAAELNSEGHCPLHLASAKGHIEIVKALLSADAKAGLIRDKDDKLPLHFAVMRGRLGVINELISAMAETEIVKVMTDIDDHGSVLHLCVCYNQLEALKILVESMRGDIDQFLSSKDNEGNTVLDLAVKRGKVKIIKYLLSLSDMSETINASKTEALRVMDMLEHYPRGFISHTIQHISNEEIAQTSSNIVTEQQDHIASPNNDPQQLQINGHEQSQTPSPNNDPPQNEQPPQNIDPPHSPQSLPINDPLQQAQSPINHPLQPTNPSPNNDPSQPSSHNPSPSNSPQHQQSPSPHNDPTQQTLSAPNLNYLQPPPFSPSDDPSLSPNNDPPPQAQSPINHPPRPPPFSPSDDPSPSPNNDPPQQAQSPINHPLQPPPFSPSDDPSPSPNNDPPQQAQSPINHPLQPTNPSPNNDPSQPSSHNPSPSNSPQHQQSPSPQNNPTQQTLSAPNLNPQQPLPVSPSEQHERTRRTKEQLMVAATVIATMTFQSVISPPGGVWQEDTTNGGYACPDYGFCEAGTAVVGYVWYPDYLKFIFFNSASFFASLCVLLILISGLPLQNQLIVWILAVLMVVAITCMLLTYMWALGLVSPNHVFYRIRDLGYILVGIWVFLLFLVCLIQIIRLVIWIRSRRKPSTQINVAAL